MTSKKKQLAAAKAIDLALKHHQSGNLQEAEKIYRQVLRKNPKHSDASHFLGVLAYQSGDYDRAEQLINRSIRSNPNNTTPHSNLGLVLQELGRKDEAVKSYRRSIALNPDNTEAHSNLGNALQGLGRLDEAVTSYRRAIKLKPDYAEAHVNIGNALQRLGHIDDAVNSYGKAIAISPDYAYAPQALSRMLGSGVRLNLQAMGSTSNLKGLLMSCLRRDDIDHQDIFLASLNVLFDQTVFDEVSGYLDAASDNEFGLDFLGNSTFSRLLQDEFLLLLLKKTVITDSLAEKFVTRIRRNLLLAAASNSISYDQLNTIQPFIFALAHQCFWNEYIFFQTSEEQQALDELSEITQDKYVSDKRYFPFYTALLACYTPLKDYNFLSERTIYEGFSGIPDLTDLLRMQIDEPLQETKIASGIKSLSGIEDDISIKVRKQYEENPYPRWTGIYKTTPHNFATTVRNDIYSNKLKGLQSINSPNILIAGCGTGRQPIKIAQRHVDSSVLAVDLSLPSLAYAQRKAHEFKVDNVEFMHADILSLSRLDRTFNFIECTGVLHHMDDPMRGWKILVDLLDSQGVMLIALYSQIARRHIVAARTFIKEEGYEPTVESIKRCRQAIFELPDEDGVKKLSRSGNLDFYSISNVRDLIFHVQEHRYTLPEIAVALEELGLELLEIAIDEQVKRSYLSRFPDDIYATSLDNWNQYEEDNPDTFVRMYHLWVKKV